MKPVTVVIPALGDVALLERALPPLFEEFDHRGAGDELVLVDDTGEGALERWAMGALAGKPARLLVLEQNRGFAGALTAGVEAARCDFVFSMNSDLCVRRGFLEPLVAALDGDVDGGIGGEPIEGVFAVAPRVLLEGDEESIESYMRLEMHRGILDFRSIETSAAPKSPTSIPFAVGGTFLFDRTHFTRLGGFDPLFAPFYFEDVDLCWRAWRRSLATLYIPDSVVEHHHKGTIGKLIDERRRRLAVERGALLFNWKHLDPEDLCDHLATLMRRAIDGWMTDDRDALLWLAKALDSRVEAVAARMGGEDGEPRTTREVLAYLTRE